MRLAHYVLVNGRPMLEPSLDAWAQWMQFSPERMVARNKVGKSTVSTIFLALDHNFSGKGPPILWETMVFGGPMHHHQERCSGSKEQAEAMHARILKLVRKANAK